MRFARLLLSALVLCPLLDTTALLWEIPAAASPCCAAGSIAPTILTGDDRAQLSASVSQSQVIGDAPPVGIPVFRADGDSEQMQTVRFDGAFLLTDRWQAGASIPLTRRSHSTPSLDSSATGVGDVSVNGAYEILPEWEYSAWKPRGYAFVQALIPTGGSIHEVSFSTGDPWGLGARGRGFYTVGAGMLLLKSWGDWDASFLTEVHHALARTFSISSGDLKLSPGWGASTALAAGYSLSSLPLRMGLALSPTYEGAILAQLASRPDSVSDYQLVWNASAQLAWMISRVSTLSARYTDQTLMGPASNVSLSRTVALMFQQRWEL